MRLINGLIAAWLLLSMPIKGVLAQEYKTVTDSYFLHTVLKGQSLYSIASMYGVTQNDIILLNPGSEEKILAGQTLKIPQNEHQAARFHTIQPQETLYQLTVKYGVTAKKICEANPGLSASNFKIGQVIVIPAAEEAAMTAKPSAEEKLRPTSDKRDGSSPCRDIHKVKKKETLFSVSRKYGISKEELIAANPELKDGMKKGMFLCIPYPQQKNNSQATNQQTSGTEKSNSELFAKNEEQRKSIRTIRAALILPFTPEKANSPESMRMTEYYEGFLMAADSLKRKGVSMELFVYDSGNEKNSIASLLNKQELKDMHIIFGPMHTNHIKPLADFARKNDIHLVIPFTSKGSAVFNNPNVYQINTPQSYLYSEVYEHFIRQFSNANVVFLQAASIDKEKSEFIEGLQHELKTYGIPYQTIAAANAVPATLKNKLKEGKNTIFIPTTGSNTILTQTLPQLVALKRENPNLSISLFGYPEWQTYTKDHLDSFYELDTYFYSSFYTNNLFPSAVNFTNSYRRWYGKDMVNSFPKFGMLGFDTGYFFLKALSQYGETFEKDIRNIQVTPIQTGFKFDRVNNWGGFINRKVFFVHFTPNYELVKLDFD